MTLFKFIGNFKWSSIVKAELFSRRSRGFALKMTATKSTDYWMELVYFTYANSPSSADCFWWWSFNTTFQSKWCHVFSTSCHVAHSVKVSLTKSKQYFKLNTCTDRTWRENLRNTWKMYLLVQMTYQTQS